MELQYPVPTRSICGLCHKRMAVYFYVKDEIWKAAIPEPIQPAEICFECFVEFADEKLLEWDKGIEFYPTSLFSQLRFIGGLDKEDRYDPHEVAQMKEEFGIVNNEDGQ